MALRIPTAVAWSVAAMALGTTLQGCGAADANPPSAPAAAAPTATKPAAAAPAAPTPAAAAGRMAVLGTFSCLGSDCTDAQWKDPNDGKDHIVKVVIDPGNPVVIDHLDPKCAKESINGKLKFRAVDLPKGYWLEIQFNTRYDTYTRKPYKGPFKRNGDKKYYPVTGRCLILDTSQDCVFDMHDEKIAMNEKFDYTVYLWNDKDELADEKDPGIMVVDTP